jgi:hypothetical protein
MVHKKKIKQLKKYFELIIFLYKILNNINEKEEFCIFLKFLYFSLYFLLLLI